MDRRSIARLAVLACIWGASFLFIKVGLEGLNPAQIVFGRLAGGAVVLVAVSRARRLRLPSGWQVWRDLVVLAVIANVVPFTLFAWAEQRITSGMAGVLNGTTPLFTLVLALALLPDERATAPASPASSRASPASCSSSGRGGQGPWEEDWRASSRACWPPRCTG